VLLVAFLGVFGALTMPGCSDDGNNETLVTIQGRVDDGTPLPSEIANAQCQFVNQEGVRLATAVADGRGEFRFRILPEVQGFIGCNHPGFPNLVLATFVSTEGIMAGEIIPAQRREEVSPRTTVVANIIAQTAPPNPRARKLELLAALEAQDPDLTMLAGAATDLFNALLERQIDNVEFSNISGEGDGEGDSEGDDDSGGVAGDVGDGAQFSPLVNVLVKFTRDLRGDTALEDLLADGTLDRPELQSIAADVQQNAAIREAFARLFPQGIQPFVNGQPLRTFTDANGAYFLPVPPNTPGFVTATPAPNLAISRAVRALQPGEEALTDQNISPPIQIFTAFLLPLLTPQDIPASQDNFLFDIGNLQEPTNGVVTVETESTPEGEIMADTDADGIACSFLGGPQAAMIDYPAAGGAAFVATTLFQGLLLEARTPTPASFTVLLGALLTRTEPGAPGLAASAADLVLGGVLDTRAPELANVWNTCVRVRIETDLGVALARVARAGRLRATVRHANGNPVPDALVRVEGDFIAFDTGGSGCPTQGDALELTDNRIVCRTDDNGRVTFVLLGNRALAAIPVTLTVELADGALIGQLETAYIAPLTRDVTVTSP
jgi:hypothetical protein